MFKLNRFIYNKNFADYFFIKPIKNVEVNYNLVTEFALFNYYELKQHDLVIGYSFEIFNTDNFLLLDDAIFYSDAEVTEDTTIIHNELFTLISDIHNFILIAMSRKESDNLSYLSSIQRTLDKVAQF